MHITSNLEPKLERLYCRRSHLRYLCVCGGGGEGGESSR